MPFWNCFLVCQKAQPQWSSYFRVLTGLSVAKVPWQILGGRIAKILLATCWPDAFTIPHANRKRSQKFQKRVCDFLFRGVGLHPLCICFFLHGAEVSHKQMCKCHFEIVSRFAKKETPQRSSSIRVLASQSVAKVTWEGLGGKLANILLATCWPDAFDIPHAKRKNQKFQTRSVTVCFEV